MRGKRRIASGEKEDASSLTTRYSPLVAFIVTAMEAVLLALVCLSPWAYGAVHPGFEFLLDAGIAVLLVLWAARMLLEGQVTWKNSGVAICLAGLFLLGVWQGTSLPRPVLARLSPGTARCYDQLLPEQPETLADDASITSSEPHPGSTLSLYPGATEREAARILAVLLVFAVVLNNLTSKEALIRLSWVAVINGVLLSLFALFQFFSAPPKTVYWTYSSQATPFGPFICHNHFPDYVNMCIGLGIGLLVSQRRRGRASAPAEQEDSPLQILRNPRALGISAALGFMLTAVVFSRSRGGLLALVGATILCGVLGWLRLGRSIRLGSSILVAAGVIVTLCAWFGIGLIKNRLTTLGTGEALDARVPLWLRSLPIVLDFPIWGTGYGTFAYIEPMYRADVLPKEGLLWYDHAHSDYLEILIEGGVVGLSLAVLALAVVYRSGLRALAANHGSRRAGLALGALFAFTALALHCFGEFGAHIPAITLLATVVCAHLCALGHSKPHRARSVTKVEGLPLASAPSSVSNEKAAEIMDADDEVYRLRLGGLAPVLGAIAALGLGPLLCFDSWKAHRIDRLEDAAFRVGNDNIDQLQTRIAYLSEAASLGPDDAQLHNEFGFAHERLAELLKKENSSDPHAADEQKILALQEYLRARDACPLLSGAQAGIASYASQLKRGDASEAYFRRAKLLTPGQDEKWYVCGSRELMLNRSEDAWATWKHCLELSDRYLPLILNQTSQLKSNQLVEKVLPDNPEILLAAALYLYPDFGSAERRRPFLEKALRLVESKGEGMGPQDLLVKARIYKAFDQPDQAIQLYRKLLNRDAFQVEWRYELAQYLRELRKFEEAYHELTVIQAQQPKNGTVKILLDAVVHQMLQDKSQERAQKRADWWLRHMRKR